MLGRQTIVVATIVVMFLFFGLIYLTKKGLRQIIKSKIYQPNRHHLRLRDVEYRDLYLDVRNGKHLTIPSGPEGYPFRTPVDELPDHYINIWYLNKFPQARVVLYFHGNRYNISYRKYMIDICNILSLNLLLVDYRGYGKSGGRPTPENVLVDADAGYQFLRSNGHCASDIIVWGESLGGTPACYTAAKYQCGALILLSTFTSLHSLLTDSENPVRNTGFWFLRLITEDINAHTNNRRLIRKVRCPILIFHSREDTLIKFANAQTLIEEARLAERKTLVEISGNHDSPKITVENFGALVRLLGLTGIGDKEIKRIVKIIDNLSFAAENSSHESLLDEQK